MGRAPNGKQKLLKKYVDRENEEGRSVMVVKCQGYLLSSPSRIDESKTDRIPVQVSHETVRTLSQNLRCNDWEGLRGFASTATRKMRVREYLIDLAKACKEERKEDAVLMVMDESYGHVNHCTVTPWYTEEQTRSSTKCKGECVIIVHTTT